MYVLGNRKVITQKAKRKTLPNAAAMETLPQGVLNADALKHLCDGEKKSQILWKIMEKFNMMILCSACYLIPCLLERVNNNQMEKPDPAIPKIHFKFTPVTEVGDGKVGRHFLPHGLFHRMIVSCCRVWKTDFRLIFYDYIVFDMEELCISLHMVHNGITVSAHKLRGGATVHSSFLKSVYTTLKQQAKQVLMDLFPNLQCVEYMECTCDRVEKVTRVKSTLSFSFCLH